MVQKEPVTRRELGLRWAGRAGRRRQTEQGRGHWAERVVGEQQIDEAKFSGEQGTRVLVHQDVGCESASF